MTTKVLFLIIKTKQNKTQFQQNPLSFSIHWTHAFDYEKKELICSLKNSLSEREKFRIQSVTQCTRQIDN